MIVHYEKDPYRNDQILPEISVRAEKGTMLYIYPYVF